MSDVLDKPAVSLSPPAPTAKAVLVYKKTLEAERDRLRNGAPELALAASRGDAEAKAALAATPALQRTADVLARISEIAARVGIDVTRLPPLIEAKPILRSDRTT
jgi:hypothetical protein